MKRTRPEFNGDIAYFTSNTAHDVDVPRIVETCLTIAIYASATSVDHPG